MMKLLAAAVAVVSLCFLAPTNFAQARGHRAHFSRPHHSYHVRPGHMHRYRAIYRHYHFRHRR